MSREKILVIDDEEDILELVSYHLVKEGYHVECAETGEKASQTKRLEAVDLIVLDLMLPGIDGVEIMKILKNDSKTAHIPIIMLTAKGEESDIVIGLELGADDYITKPFSPRELVSRVRAVLRRTEMSGVSTHGLIEVDERLKLDFGRHEVWVEDNLVKLRPTEYRLLYHLVQNAGWVLTHDQILTKVWGYEYRDEPHYVRLYINDLRQKIEKDPANPKYILTERGVGYRFIDFRRDKALLE